jgi:UV DNA damage repair endonuclease
MNRQRKKTLRLVIHALQYYQREFYGWSARLHPAAKKIWDEYEEAITSFQSELEEISEKKTSKQTRTN